MKKLTKILLGAALFFGIGTASAQDKPAAPTFTPDGGTVLLDQEITMRTTSTKPGGYLNQWIYYNIDAVEATFTNLTTQTAINEAKTAGTIKQYSAGAKPTLEDLGVQEGEKVSIGAAVAWIPSEGEVIWSDITVKEFTAEAVTKDLPVPVLSPGDGATVKQGQKITFEFSENFNIENCMGEKVYALYTEDDDVTLETNFSHLLLYENPDAVIPPTPYHMAIYENGDDGLAARTPIRIPLDATGTVTFRVRLAALLEDEDGYMGMSFVQSEITSVTYTVEAAAEVAAPVFDPGEGEVVVGTEVSITAPDADNMIWYVIDGSDEDLTEAGYNDGKCQQYEEPIKLRKNATIKAVSVQGEQSPFLLSAVATATYTVNSDGTEFPTLTLDPEGPITVKGSTTFSCRMNPQAYTHKSNKIGFAFKVKNGAGIESLECRTSVDDEWTAYNAAGLNTIQTSEGYMGALPGSTYKTAPLQDTTVYYRLTLKAYATQAPEFTFTVAELSDYGIWPTTGGLDILATATLQFEIFKPDTLPMPKFSPVAGEVVKGTAVALSCDTADAKIYYSINADTVTENSLEYTAAIAIDSNMSIRAIAVLEDFVSSPVAVAAYTVKAEDPVVEEKDTLPMPKFSVEAGEVVKGTTVTLSCDTADAKIYYSINADTVTENSLEYTAAIAIDSNMTIRAIAVKEGFVNSPVAVAAYTVKEETANEGAELAGVRVYPNPNAGTFSVDVPERARVEIFGLNGAMLMSREVNAGVAAFNLDHSGIYFVRVTANNKTAIKRVVVR